MLAVAVLVAEAVVAPGKQEVVDQEPVRVHRTFRPLSVYCPPW
jgi:hypothetical protein